LRVAHGARIWVVSVFDPASHYFLERIRSDREIERLRDAGDGFVAGGVQSQRERNVITAAPQVSQPHQLAAGWIEFGQERIGE